MIQLQLATPTMEELHEKYREFNLKEKHMGLDDKDDTNPMQARLFVDDRESLG